MDLLPEGTPLVTLGVTEPFTTSLKVSFYAAIALVLPIILWQVWAFFAPAVSDDTQRVIGVFVVLATDSSRPASPSATDRAPEARWHSSSTTTPSSTRADPRELLPLVRRR